MQKYSGFKCTKLNYTNIKSIHFIRSLTEIFETFRKYLFKILN